jgi:aspartyl protease family protein
VLSWKRWQVNDPTVKHKGISRVMQALAWISVMALLALYFEDVLERQRNPNRSIDSALTEDGTREVVLRRNRMGHYVTSGTINGEGVVFLLDTGATGVAIPEAIAEKLGLPRGRPFLSRTANGTARSYQTNLGEVGVGAIRLRDVDASITPGLEMNEILLGMSFLKHIEFTQRGKTLTLRQYPGS